MCAMILLPKHLEYKKSVLLSELDCPNSQRMSNTQLYSLTIYRDLGTLCIEFYTKRRFVNLSLQKFATIMHIVTKEKK